MKKIIKVKIGDSVPDNAELILTDDNRKQFYFLIPVEEKKEEKDWTPDYNNKYWFIDDTGDIDFSSWSKDGVDKGRKKFLGIFKTKEEALKARDRILAVLKNN